MPAPAADRRVSWVSGNADPARVSALGTWGGGAAGIRRREARLTLRYEIREIEPEDLPAAAEIYRDSIRRAGREYYTAVQVDAWSSFADDEARFATWVDRATTYVAVEREGRVVGFGGLESRCRIASLYVAPDRQRRGVGSRLLAYLLERSREFGCEFVTTEASEFSKALFETHGFSVVELETTEFKGVEFTRHRMRARV